MKKKVWLITLYSEGTINEQSPVVVYFSNAIGKASRQPHKVWKGEIEISAFFKALDEAGLLKEESQS